MRKQAYTIELTAAEAKNLAYWIRKAADDFDGNVDETTPAQGLLDAWRENAALCRRVAAILESTLGVQPVSRRKAGV